MQVSDTNAAAQTATTTEAGEPTDAQIRDSAAQIINVLTGSTKTGESLQHERIPEDVLMAAIVHAQLVETQPVVAQRLLKRLKINYDKQMKQKKRQPIFRAVDEILNVAVGNKKRGFSKKEKNRIMNYAFDKAQLDDKENRLSRRPIDLTGGDSSQSNVDLIMGQVAENTVDSAKDVRQLREKIKNKPKLRREAFLRQKEFLGQIDPKEIPAKKPADPPKTEKEPEVPTVDDYEIAPDSISIYPQKSDITNLTVVLPEAFSDNVSAVYIYSDADAEEPLVTFEAVKEDEEGRIHWEADKSVDDIDGPVILLIEHIDGSVRKREIEDLSKFQTESYSY